MAKKYKPQKPNSKIKVKKIQDTEGLNTGFGNYKEATGGGHPFEAGNSNTRTTRENGKLREAENPETNQPRTEDGKFTYKSVNGQSINPEYGPSRGVTVPPTLTGGQNGVKIEDVEKEFKSEKGSYWDKYKDKWFREKGMVVTEGLSTKISAEAVWNMAKEYDKDLGEYKGEGENWSTKTGRKSKEEKAAVEQVQQGGGQQNVIEAESGGIKTMGKKFKQFVKDKEEPEVPAQEEPVGEQPVSEEPQEIQAQPWGKSGKFNSIIHDNFLAKMKNELGSEYDEEQMTDELVEDFLLSLSDEDIQEIIDYKKK